MRPERRALAPAAVLVALYVARVLRTGELTYGFLLWNLALATVPALLACAADALTKRRARAAAALVLLGWLAFLPNAPYLVTDFVHLDERTGVPLWFDVALLGSAALAGFALGAASLSRVAGIVARTPLGPAGGTTCALAASLACGFGVYLGRFARLNTWDLLVHPAAVARDVIPPFASPLDHPRAWGVTLVFGALTAASYLAASRPTDAQLAAGVAEPSTNLAAPRGNG